MSESTNLERKQISLSENEYTEVENMAGLNYTVKQMAMYLDVSPTGLQKEFDNPDSELRYRYDRGKLIAQTAIESANQKNAKEGNTTAIQIQVKNKAASEMKQLIYELFGV